MTQLTGRVLNPNDTGWNAARIGFAAAADYDQNAPRVIVFCKNASDVTNAVVWSRENDRPIRIRCGRHNYEGWSSLVKNGVIIDVSEIDSVSISQDRTTAKVGSGASVGRISEALNEVRAAIPLATGPTVGISGLVLGGGFGMTSRKWGLTCDSLVGVDIVLADGRLITASYNQNADLFWACCGGGGGSFGIATSFTFVIHHVSNVALLTANYPWSLFAKVVDRFQRWMGNADDSVTAFLSLLSNRTVQIQAQFTADAPDLEMSAVHFAPMLDQSLHAEGISMQKLPYTDASRIVMGVDPKAPLLRSNMHDDHQIFKSSSSFAGQLLPLEAINFMKYNLEHVPPLMSPPSQPTMIQLLGGGGQIARRDPTDTAAYHRLARLVVQYDAYWTDPQDAQRTIEWHNSLRDSMLNFTHGAYVNYSDASIKNPLKQYFGPNLERLVSVKRKYDPHNIFNFQQSIPVNVPPE